MSSLRLPLAPHHHAAYMVLHLPAGPAVQRFQVRAVEPRELSRLARLAAVRAAALLNERAVRDRAVAGRCGVRGSADDAALDVCQGTCTLVWSRCDTLYVEAARRCLRRMYAWQRVATAPPLNGALTALRRRRRSRLERTQW